jgi:ABC-2 family transporter protein
MTAAPAMRFRGERRPAEQWIAVIWVELLLRLRDTNVPIMAACVAAVCVLLTPSAEAGYAVITFGGMKPVMSAHNALVAAGLVLSLVMLPVYVLGLGLGCARDRGLRTGPLLAASPVDAGSIAGGRLAANAIVVMVFSLATLILVAVAVVSRLKNLPGAPSMAAYLLIVVPAGMCSLPLGALLDRYFGERDTAKAIATIMFWSVLMVASLAAWPDAFGFTFLRQNAPAGAGSDFSVGIVGAEHLSRVSWKTVELTSQFVASRIWMLGAVLMVCIAVCFVTRAGMLRSIGRAPAWPESGSASAAIAIAELPRIRPSAAGPVLAARTVARRWLKGSNVVAIVFAAAVTVGILSPSVRLVLGVALLIPLAIVNERRISGSLEIRLFERSNTALWWPSPLVFTSLLLAVLTAVPAIPVLTRVTVMRSVHVVVAILAASLWLTWSCAGIARPLLGISVYTLAWYLECFGDLPPTADLLGLGASSPLSLAAAAALTIVLGFLTFRKDTYGYRSNRHG